MDCIKCKKPMKKAKLEGVLVDKCDTCRGVWLDGGELEMLQRDYSKTDQELKKEAINELMDEKMRLITTEGLCPKCQGQSINTYMRSGVELDQCPACKGIFFDYGELDKIMKAEKSPFRKFLSGMKTFVTSPK